MYFSIGETARRCGCSVQSLRHYQALGLLQPAGYTAGGQRLYDAAGLQRAHFIRAARAMGFGLPGIGEMLTLSDAPGADCEQVRALACAQLRETEKRMRELRSLQAALKQLVGACSGGSAADCRILAAMNGDGLASNRPGEPRWA